MIEHSLGIEVPDTYHLGLDNMCDVCDGRVCIPVKEFRGGMRLVLSGLKNFDLPSEIPFKEFQALINEKGTTSPGGIEMCITHQKYQQEKTKPVEIKLQQ